MSAQNYKDIVFDLRNKLLDIELAVRALPSRIAGGIGGDEKIDWHEVIDQAKLALRHVEDARMRLGKVLQHGRGVGAPSVYDDPK